RRLAVAAGPRGRPRGVRLLREPGPPGRAALRRTRARHRRGRPCRPGGRRRPGPLGVAHHHLHR
ncbi:hypothetical protein D7V93_39635, partial [Corallococcus llansteffanensis]